MAGRKPASPDLLADFAKALPEGDLKKLGRRSSTQKTAKPPTRLPALGETPESVQRYTAALAQRIESGDLTTSAARALTDAANTHLRAVNARLNREGIERYEQMLREARELRKDGLAYEEACKKHKEEPLLGKWIEVTLPDGSTAVKRAP